MMTKEEENQIAVTLLSEIIYELYEDSLKGKLKNDLCLKDKGQVVGKSADKKNKTFQ